MRSPLPAKVWPRRFWLAPLLSLLVACGGADIQTRDNYDPNVDWNRLSSFTWLGIRAPRSLDEFDVKRIENALRRELTQKGLLERTDTRGADLGVAAYVGVMPQAVDRWKHTKGILWTRSTDVVAAGTLIVEIFALPSAEVVWRGSAERQLNQNPTPQETQRSIDQVVQKLLARFPPSPETQASSR